MKSRSNCVICKNDTFEIMNTFNNFPVISICSNSNEYITCDKSLILCNNCNCLQLKYLVDPSILYSSSYTTNSFSPSWVEHHNSFANFILENTNTLQFLEIGANKGDLYKNMSKERVLHYTILDMYKDANIPSEIKFIEGNCETYDFSGHNSIIMSHVFEHLYNPSKFIERLQFSKVNEIFISHPDFDFVINKKYINTVNFQHTFFCGLEHLMYIFSLYNYKCESFYKYNGNYRSIHCKFVYNESYIAKELTYNNKQIFIDTYINKVKDLQDLKIPENTIICPSGIFGQYLYYFIRNKDNIIGFIDNNIERQNKKLYGTDKMVYSPKDIDYTNKTILLCDTYYNNEIIAGLKEICPTVNIIIV